MVPPRLLVSFEHSRRFLEDAVDSLEADIHGHPALTMFLWQSGARFDTIMNMYTSAGFPVGIDPRLPSNLKAFGSFSNSVDTSNRTLSEGIDFRHPTSSVHPNVLNSHSDPSQNATIDTLFTESS